MKEGQGSFEASELWGWRGLNDLGKGWWPGHLGSRSYSKDQREVLSYLGKGHDMIIHVILKGHSSFLVKNSFGEGEHEGHGETSLEASVVIQVCDGKALCCPGGEWRWVLRRYRLQERLLSSSPEL